jgi:hypothetical protein
MAKKETAPVPTVAAQLVAPVVNPTVAAGIDLAFNALQGLESADAGYTIAFRNMLCSVPFGDAQQMILIKQYAELKYAGRPAAWVKAERALRYAKDIVIGISKTKTSEAKKGIGQVEFSESLAGDCLASFGALLEKLGELRAGITGKEEKRGASTTARADTKTTTTVEPAAAPAAKEPTSSKACIALILRSLKMLEGFNLKMKDSEKFVLSSAVDTLESLEARAA